MILGFIAAICALVIDLASKYYVAQVILAEKSSIVYTSFFNLVKMWNTGVSFSMFNNWGKVGVVILSVFASAVVLLLAYWLYKEKNRLAQVALGLIIGGAIGNIADRIRFGAVFDFLDFHIMGYHWPAFNLADSFICVGAFMVVIANLWQNYKKEK